MGSVTLRPLYSKVRISGIDQTVRFIGSKIGLNVMGFPSPQSVMLGGGGGVSAVGIATRSGPEVSRFEQRLGKDFPQLSRPAARPSQSPVKMGTGCLSGRYSCRGVALTNHPQHPAPKLKK
jgi:hypothetical protein